MRWFRLHSKILNDPRVQSLDGDEFKMYINLLCHANERAEGGNLGNVSEICFALRETETAFQKRFIALQERELCVTDGETFHIPQWSKKQYKTDTSTERVRKHRKRSRNVTVTAPDTDTEYIKGLPNGSPKNKPPSDEIETAFKAYNNAAEQNDLPKAQRLTKSRKAAIGSRLKECGGLDGWNVALEKMAASEFLTGGNDRGWRANIDFISRQSSFTKLMEGEYDNREGKPNGQAANDSTNLRKKLADQHQRMFGGSSSGPEHSGSRGADIGAKQIG